MSEDFLAAMAASSHARAQAARRAVPEAALRAHCAQLAPPPALRRGPGFDLIAELKLRSPAAGALQAEAATDIAARVVGYAQAGAAAISVLTEPSRFDGNLAHLERAAAALAPHAIPTMRKDFLVDPYQVLEARAAGAGGILVILRMLPRAELEALIDAALELSLFVLLEAFDEPDIALAGSLVTERAADRERLLVGVNCRDLVTLRVVPGRLESLAPELAALPGGVAWVAESGVASAADAARVAAAGYELALVGSALMTGADPGTLAASMIAAGRAARAVPAHTVAEVGR